MKRKLKFWFFTFCKDFFLKILTQIIDRFLKTDLSGGIYDQWDFIFFHVSRIQWAGTTNIEVRNQFSNLIIFRSRIYLEWCGGHSTALLCIYYHHVTDKQLLEMIIQSGNENNKKKKMWMDGTSRQVTSTNQLVMNDCLKYIRFEEWIW